MAVTLDLQPYTLFVLVGMGAMMAGVSKTPIAAAVLLTEMVGGFIVLIPLMIASTVSYLVSGKYTLYDSQITSCHLGVDFSTLGEVQVKDVMTKDPVTIELTASQQDVLDTVRDHPHYIYPVVQDGRLVGVVTRTAIQQRSDQGFTVSDILEKGFQSIQESCPASDAFEIMSSMRISAIVVVDSIENNRPVGIVTRIDIFSSMEHMDESHHAFCPVAH